MKNLSTLARKKTRAKEKLTKIKAENKQDLEELRELKEIHESVFITLLRKYKVDKKFVEKDFMECCEVLSEYIIEERKTEKRFKKICKPYYDKYVKIKNEYENEKMIHKIKQKNQKKRKKIV